MSDRPRKSIFPFRDVIAESMPPDEVIVVVHAASPPPAPITHCVKGHPAEWCTCRTFKPAAPGAFLTYPTIRRPPPPTGTP